MRAKMIEFENNNLHFYLHKFDSFQRHKGLGGTDIASILGFHEYNTALDVFLAKHGKQKEFKETTASRMGQLWEDPIAQLYFEINELEKDHRNLKMIDVGTVTNPELSWAFGSPDKIIVDQHGQWLWGLEVKTVGIRSEHLFGESFSNQIPQRFYLQCFWYLIICRSICRLMEWEQIEYWDLIVLIGGQDERQYRIFYDEEVEDHLLSEACDFWENSVLNKNPPKIIIRDHDSLPLLWPEDDGTVIKADENIDKLVENLQNVDKKIEKLEKKRSEIKLALKLIIGENSVLESNTWKITWKKRKAPKRVDWQGIVKQLNPPEEMVAAFTKYGRPQRPFITNFNKKKRAKK
jgi:predicted phage-related endonuclease